MLQCGSVLTNVLVLEQKYVFTASITHTNYTDTWKIVCTSTDTSVKSSDISFASMEGLNLPRLYAFRGFFLPKHVKNI